MKEIKLIFVKILFIVFSLLLLSRLLFIKAEDEIDLSFPDGFSIGIGTSAYQIEGAWNVSGKGESIWDRYVHENPLKIENQSTGDIACDSYHKFKEDVQHIKDMGLDHYRFSLSWPRILPTGYSHVVNKEGIKYYHDLLDELEKNKIVPFVTIYHWDHPEPLQKLGGWTNEIMVDLFGDYARVVFREFGHRVKFFTTINEPFTVCREGYTTGLHAPGYKLNKTAEYLCGHNILKAHARAYHIYNNEFRATQSGKVGIALPCFHHFLKNKADVLAQELAFQFECGRFAHPIFSKEGDYPEVVRRRIAEKSEKEGRTRSKLPTFTKEWIEYIKGTADYFGLNHYTSAIVESDKDERNEEGVIFSTDPQWPSGASSWLKIVPEGLRNLLIQIKDRYENPPVYILENGISDNGTISDIQRIKYFHSYMREMLKAVIHDGCNVRAYTIWSLLDNFEWDRGYSEYFGVIKVDFNDTKRSRIAKQSAQWIKSLLSNRKLSPDPLNNLNLN